LLHHIADSSKMTKSLTIGRDGQLIKHQSRFAACNLKTEKPWASLLGRSAA